MDNLLKQEYFHIGSDRIYKELWLDIQTDQIYHFEKPYGGLWASHLRTDDNRLCDWVDFLEEKEPMNLERLSYRKNCLIKFKEDIPFLQVRNKNDFKNLKDSGFVKDISSNSIYSGQYITETLDYEKISDYYDLLYVRFCAHPSLKKFCINTMLALNCNAIEYYKPIIVNYSKQKIIRCDNPLKITEPCQEYYQLVNYIVSNFNDIKFNGNYEEYIRKLNTYKNHLISLITTNLSGLGINLPSYLDSNEIIDIIIQNLYRKKYREKQKTLK